MSKKRADVVVIADERLVLGKKLASGLYLDFVPVMEARRQKYFINIRFYGNRQEFLNAKKSIGIESIFVSNGTITIISVSILIISNSNLQQ